MPLFCLKKTLGVLFALVFVAVGLCGVSFAEDILPFHELGIRYYPAEGELCVTRDAAPEDALRLLGVDAPTMGSAMTRSQVILVCLTPAGRQISLRCFDKPAKIVKESVFAMEVFEKEQFLALVARQGFYASAAWQESAPGFALFSTFAPGTATAGVHTLALSTLYLNRVYAFETDIIGRAPTEADAAVLLDAAKRTLFLGAAEQAELAAGSLGSLPLPEPAALTEENALFIEEMSDTPLALSPFPKVIGVTSPKLQGVTAPNAFVRYSVNGKASSRFKAGADGSFSVTMKGLKPDETNQIEVTAFQGESVSVIRFSVDVDWQPTPLVLFPTSGEVQTDSVLLTGATLPGAAVRLIRQQGDTNLRVAADGSFSHEVSTKRVGEIKFTLRALADGYRRTELQVTLTRTPGPADELGALMRQVKDVSYDELAQNPAAYQDQVTVYEGVITALANQSGQPCFLLDIGDGQRLLCLCDNLLPMELGQRLRIVGMLLGDSMAMEQNSSELYPALKFAAIVP